MRIRLRTRMATPTSRRTRMEHSSTQGRALPAVVGWSLAGPLEDGVHLLGVEDLQGRSADVAGGDSLQDHSGGRLVVGKLGHHDQVVLAKGPQQLANLAAVLLDQTAVVLGPADSVAEVLKGVRVFR